MADPSILLLASSAIVLSLIAVAEILKRLRLVGMEYDNLMAWWHGRPADHRRRKKPTPRRGRRKSRK